MIESVEICERFDRYFERAVAEWSEEVEVKSILFKSKNKDLFSTIDMCDLSERISHVYLGRDDEVIMRHLHDCIYIVPHFAAKHMSLVRPRDLRRWRLGRFLKICCVPYLETMDGVIKILRRSSPIFLRGKLGDWTVHEFDGCDEDRDAHHRHALCEVPLFAACGLGSGSLSDILQSRD